MICKNCIHKEVCKHKSKSVYACENYKEKVVTCESCRYCEISYPIKEIDKDAVCGYKCQIINSYISPNHFCGYAERKAR